MWKCNYKYVDKKKVGNLLTGDDDDDDDEDDGDDDDDDLRHIRFLTGQLLITD